MLADRLVLYAFVPRFIAAFLAGLTVHGAVELVDLVNVAGGGALATYPLRMPTGVVLVSPFAMLIGGCWTCVHLVRTGQLGALQAAGRGPRRGLLSLVLVGALWGVIVWWIATVVAPLGMSRWATAQGPDGTSGSGEWPRWVSGGGGALVRLSGPEERGVYRDVMVLRLDDEGDLAERLEAASMEREGDRWVLRDVLVARPGRPPERVEEIDLGVGLASPSTAAPPSHLIGKALARASEEVGRSGRDRAPYDAERGLRGALAVACPVCLALGVLVGVALGRRPGAAAAAVAGVGLLYWLLLSPMWAIATAGGVSGDLVTWGPGAAFGAVCLFGWLVTLE